MLRSIVGLALLGIVACSHVVLSRWVARQSTHACVPSAQVTVGLDGAIDQVILVECDTPKLEHRAAFAPAPLEPANLSAASCD